MRFLLFYIPRRLYGLKGYIYFNANKKHNDQVKEETGSSPNYKTDYVLRNPPGKDHVTCSITFLMNAQEKGTVYSFFVFPISFPHK